MSELWIAETKDWTGTQNNETRMRLASPSEIIEAARNLPGVEEVVVRQNALGESVIHMAGNPLADAAVNLRSGHHVVILIADARRTEEEM